MKEVASPSSHVAWAAQKIPIAGQRAAKVDNAALATLPGADARRVRAAAAVCAHGARTASTTSMRVFAMTRNKTGGTAWEARQVRARQKFARAGSAAMARRKAAGPAAVLVGRAPCAGLSGTRRIAAARRKYKMAILATSTTTACRALVKVANAATPPAWRASASNAAVMEASAASAMQVRHT